MSSWLEVPRNRTLAGGLLALGLAGFMIGLMACLPPPPPVGDPEKSRIDARVSGVWFQAVGEPLHGDDPAIWVFRPWDSRTWLCLVYMLEPVDEPECPEDAKEPAGFDDLLTTCDYQADGMIAYKVWKTVLGGVDFLTHEPTTTLDSEVAFLPPVWFTMRVEFREGALALTMIDPGLAELEAALEGVAESDFNTPEVRAKVEAVVARNARNPDLYDSGVVELHRVPQDRYDDVADFIEDRFPVPTER